MGNSYSKYAYSLFIIVRPTNFLPSSFNSILSSLPSNFFALFRHEWTGTQLLTIDLVARAQPAHFLDQISHLALLEMAAQKRQ